MCSYIRALVWLLTICCVGVSSANAAPFYWQVNSTGADTTIPLDSSMAGQILMIYAASADPDAQSADIAVQGLGGEEVSVDSFSVADGESVREALERGSAPTTLWFDRAEFSRMKLTALDPGCGCLTAQQQSDLLALYQRWVPAMTAEDLCRTVALPEGSVCDESQAAPTIYATAFIPYNRCLSSLRPAVVVKVNLSRVSGASLTGAHLTVAIRMRRFFGRSGSNWATFKMSDGRKFPGWIALTEVVSPDGTLDDLRFVHWSSAEGRVPSRVRAVPRRGDQLYYGGRLFKRTPIGKLLTGGRGTVEVSRYGEGYSFCARFSTKARQNFNGYRKLH